MTPIDDRISAWLDRLAAELAADDPAVRHDALSDAREHLVSARAELPDDASDDDLRALLAEYGEPAEVANSYRDAERLLHGTPRTAVDDDVAPDEAPTATQPQATASWVGVVRDPDAWSALLYMLLALPLGIAWFTWTVTGGALSASLLILIIGVPIALAFLASIRGIALLDGRIVETLLGERMPRRTRPGADTGAGLLKRVQYWLLDRRTWTSIAYLLLMLPLGIAYFTLAVVGLSAGATFATLPAWLAVMAIDGTDVPPWTWRLSLPSVPAGICVLLATLHLARAVGALHGRLAKAMLVGGDGAASRRRPVAPASSLARFAILAGVGIVTIGGLAAAGAALEQANTTVRRVTVEATGVGTLALDLEQADVRFVTDPALEPGMVTASARVRVSDEDKDRDDLLQLDRDGSNATLRANCSTVVAFFSVGCDVNVTVRVAPDSGIVLRGSTEDGDIELGGGFDGIDLRSSNGDIEGVGSAPRIALDTDNGDIELSIVELARDVTIESDNGDVELVAPGTWNLQAGTNNGDEDIDLRTDPDAERTMRLQADNGDIEARSQGIDD